MMGQRRETRDVLPSGSRGDRTSQDVETFARALSFLIERPELRREMGERGRAFVRMRLSKERLVRDVEEVYRGLLGIKHKTAPTPSAETLVQS